LSVADSTGSVSAYWTLVANPDIYEIDRAIAEISEDTWTTKGRPVAKGDRVTIWRAGGRRRLSRGVIALGEVVTDPEDRPYDSPYWIHELEGEEPRVGVRYVVPPGLPLLVDGPHAEILDISADRAGGGPSSDSQTKNGMRSFRQPAAGRPAMRTRSPKRARRSRPLRRPTR
jgi:EVE domain